jgi:hypothetical protein
MKEVLLKYRQYVIVNQTGIVTDASERSAI